MLNIKDIKQVTCSCPTVILLYTPTLMYMMSIKIRFDPKILLSTIIFFTN